MAQDSENLNRKQLGRRIFFGVIVAAVVALLLVTLDTERNPRTDDASVRANFIEIAPEVSGRLAQLPVKDNAYVKQGDLLFVIDPRDYAYALRQALSDQENLEQRIIDTKRKIAAQNSAVEAASAAVHNSTTAIHTAGSGVDLAKATVLRAQAAANAAEAQLKYATNDLHRIEPLLQKQYVTVDQVDQANTAVRVARGSYDAAVAALSEAQAQETQAVLRQQEADDQATESRAKLGQSIHIVDTLDILESQRPGLAARVDRARLDLERCRVVAPFDAYVTNVLSVAIVTFIGGMILVSTSLPSLGGAIGFISCVVIGFWEHQAPEDTLVKNSLRLVAAFAMAAACCVAVEYLFGVRSPADLLEEQFRIRYRALEEMFSLCAQEEVSPKQRFDAAARVSRLAVAGPAGMMDLYNHIIDRNLDIGSLPIGTRVHITMLAELMDDSAAFGLQSETRDDPEFRQRCARIAEQCGRLIPAAIPESEKRLEPGPQTTNSLLDRVEVTIHSILVMPVDLGAAKNKELAVLPSRKVPFLIPGAIRDKDNIAFALKISLCATLCYIVYNAIDWPGISTSVTTVMVTGLSTTAAMKQRFTLRILGSLLGGLILGLGTIAFLFPYMDSVTSLIVLVGTVAFVASWIAGGSLFNYLGLQIAFAFYLVALLDFSASTELAPARDRFMGILFALVVMWFVLDQIWPVRTVTAMRRILVSALRSGASLFFAN
jgi:multidrug resistance efflux pump